MIECPICHVQNDDRSLFCAECGQRFAPAPSQAAPIPPQVVSQAPPTTPEESPKRPPMKLRSPMLGAPDDEIDNPPAPSRPFGKQVDTSSALRPKGRLRGAADEPAPDESFSKSQTNPPGRRGLHSPLLHMGVEEEDEEEAPPPSSGMFPHRSNSRLSAHAPESTPTPPVRSKSLRSPLLGGDPQYEEEEEPISNTRGGRPRLRSPVLGGPVGQYEEEYEPPVVDDDPNTLRSPLLARRVSKAEATPPPQPQTQTQKSPMQDPAPANPRIEPLVSAHPTVSAQNAPANQQPQPTAQQAPPAPYSGNPPNLAANSLSGFNAQTYGSGFGGPHSADYAPGQAPLGPSAGFEPPSGYQGNATWPVPAQPGVPAQTNVTPPAPPPGPPKVMPPAGGNPSVSESARGYGAPSRNEARFDSDTESGASSSKSDVQYGEALPNRFGNRSATRSKMLPHSESTSEPVGRGDSFQPARKYMGFAKFMLFPLVCAIGFKVWYLFAMGATALQSMPFLGDQVSQLVVLVCLMIFTFLATSESGS